MAKIEKIGNIQIVDNKEDKFFYFPMISMACTGTGISSYNAQGIFNRFVNWLPLSRVSDWEWPFRKTLRGN